MIRLQEEAIPESMGINTFQKNSLGGFKSKTSKRTKKRKTRKRKKSKRKLRKIDFFFCI